MKTAKILFVDDEIDLKRLLKQRLKKIFGQMNLSCCLPRMVRKR